MAQQRRLGLGQTARRVARRHDHPGGEGHGACVTVQQSARYNTVFYANILNRIKSLLGIVHSPLAVPSISFVGREVPSLVVDFSFKVYHSCELVVCRSMGKEACD